MFPTYREIETPLLDELRRRGGRARPVDRDAHGRTIYEALADHFRLTPQDLRETITENGKQRSKWENMVRYARRHLVDLGHIDNSVYGVWRLK